MVGGLLYSSTLFSSYLYIYHTTAGASPAVQFSKKKLHHSCKKATCAATECSRDVDVAVVLRAHKEG